ncbi:MAG: hypothetical protein R3A50_16850 [Saprospiraceae bacterium]
MKSSLLVRTIQQLPPKERKELLDFLKCPLFNRRDEVSRLCEYLVNNVDKPARNAFTAELLFSTALPGEGYDNRRLRHIMSYALEATRHFIALLDWQSNEADRQHSLIRSLRNRNMDKLFEKEVNKAVVKGEQQSVRDARHHFNQYQLLHEKLEQKARNERSSRLDLQPLPDELTVFYVAEMLRHACASLSHQAVAGKQYQVKLLDAILDVATQTKMLESPAVAVYYQAYKMLSAPDENEPFEQLKKLLKIHEGSFTREEMRGLYLMAINGCIRRLNSGRREYAREAFEVYQTALERDFLTEKGYLSSFTYKNIIRIGALVGEHAWTETFLESHRNSLHPTERENIYRYNRAFLLFQKGDYANAMPLLQQVEFEDTLNNLHARRMLVRSYFELEEFTALESLLQSFSSYLNRQKDLGYHREPNIKFVRYTARLLKLSPYDNTTRKALFQEISENKSVAEQEWLLSKLVLNNNIGLA